MPHTRHSFLDSIATGTEALDFYSKLCYSTFVPEETTHMNITTRSILRESLQAPDENSGPLLHVAIAQALISAANHYGYKRNDTDEMIVEVDDLLETAYQILNSFQ